MIKASVVKAGTNNYQTGADEVSYLADWFFTPGVPPIGSIVVATPNTGDFATQAQGTPNKTVKVKAGKMLMRATPTSEAERMFMVVLTADANVTIADNATGSTVYDKVYLKLPADSLANPPADGDLTETLCLLTERHTAAGEALTATNAIELAEVTVTNGFSSIVNTNINDNRVNSSIEIEAAQEDWISPSFLNNWINLEGWSTCAYMKDSLGFVHLKGVVANGTVAPYPNGAIFALPAGYRPVSNMIFPSSSNNTIGRISIQSNSVVAESGNNTYFSLDGITFKAEA